jgi:MFS family permease
MTRKRLLNKDFVLLFQGQLVSQIGSSIYMIALIFWVKHATESATLVGILSMTATIPGVLLGPFGGTVADLFSRKLIIVLGDLINGVLIISIATIMFLSPDSTDLIITLLFFEAVVGGTVMAVFRPAISAAIPDLVPESKIQAANGMYQSSAQIALLIGQSVGGLLFRILGAPLVMMIDGITYLFSALSESFISIPQQIRERKKGFGAAMQEFKGDTVDGLRYVRRVEGLVDLFAVIAVATFFTAPFGVLLPFFVEDTLGVTADWFGYIIASLALGSIIGSILAGVVKISPVHKGKYVIVAVGCQALCLGTFGYSGSPVIAMLLLGLVGVVGGVMNVMVISVIQLSTPSEIRGRVFGLLTTLSAGLAPVSMGLSGVVADALDGNIPLIYAFSGIGVFLVLPFLVFNGGFHRMMAYESSGDEESGSEELLTN